MAELRWLLRCPPCGRDFKASTSGAYRCPFCLMIVEMVALENGPLFVVMRDV